MAGRYGSARAKKTTSRGEEGPVRAPNGGVGAEASERWGCLVDTEGDEGGEGFRRMMVQNWQNWKAGDGGTSWASWCQSTLTKQVQLILIREEMCQTDRGSEVARIPKGGVRVGWVMVVMNGVTEIAADGACWRELASWRCNSMNPGHQQRPIAHGSH